MASEDFLTVEPVDSVADGCPVKMKTRIVLTERGKPTIVKWELRDREGNPIDLSDEADVTAEVRIQDVMQCSAIGTIEATLTPDSPAYVEFTLPETIYKQVGIFKFSVAIKDADDQIIFINDGLLSNERSLFGYESGNQDDPGPLTLQEIRLQLRDTMIENNLLDQVEFDDAELIHAMIMVIREWNETPPPVAKFGPHNFPFRYNWLMGTCGNLLRVAAAHYLRNDLQSSHGGVQLNDKAKAQPYLAVAGQILGEWKTFIVRQKVAINARRAYGSVGSPYYRPYGY